MLHLKKSLIIILCFICFVGCASNKESSINYVQAKEKIINEGAILLDVRSTSEYNEEHIGEAVNIPVDEITENSVKSLVNSVDDVIIVYCQNGIRSAEAMKKLNDLGYTRVYDLGAMSNWKEKK